MHGTLGVPTSIASASQTGPAPIVTTSVSCVFRDPWGSYSEYSSDIDYIPVTCDWEAGDHPAEDSLYLWGPELPKDFVTNYEAEVPTAKVAAELVAAS